MSQLQTWPTKLHLVQELAPVANLPNPGGACVSRILICRILLCPGLAALQPSRMVCQVKYSQPRPQLFRMSLSAPRARESMAHHNSEELLPAADPKKRENIPPMTEAPLAARASISIFAEPLVMGRGGHAGFPGACSGTSPQQSITLSAFRTPHVCRPPAATATYSCGLPLVVGGGSHAPVLQCPQRRIAPS